MRPINIVSFTFYYMVYIISVYLIPIYDVIIKFFINRKIIKKHQEPN